MKRYPIYLLFLTYFFGLCGLNAATYTVTNNSDANIAGSLRWALTQAESNGGHDTIVFSGNLTIEMTGNNRIFILDNEGVTIDAGDNEIILDGTQLTGDADWPMVGIWITDTNYHWPPWGRLCGNAEINGITFQNFAHGGALITGGARHNTFKNCTFRDNGTDGIKIDGSVPSTDGTQFSQKNTIKNCTFYSNGQSGIYLYYTDNTDIENCTFNENTYHGVLVSKGENIRVRDCEMYSNGQAGIWFINECSGSSVTGCSIGTLSGNESLGNTWPGVLVSGQCSYIVMENNIIGFNQAEGIKIDDHCSQITCRQNKILSNKFSGILITGSSSSNTFTHNTITSNEQSGIWITNFGSNNRIHGNRIGTDGSDKNKGNGWSGVLISDGATDNFVGGDIPDSGNVIAWNKSIGVKIDGKTSIRNLVRFNTFFENAGGGFRVYNGANQGLPVPYLYPPVSFSSPGNYTVWGLSSPDTVVDLYISDSDTDKTQARYYLGTVKPDQNNEFSYSFYYAHPPKLVTAIAHGPARNSSGFEMELTDTGVTGTVIDSGTGKPVLDAEVYLFKESGNIYSATRTGTDGKFAFYVTSGKYYLQVKKEGYIFPSTNSQNLTGAEQGVLFTVNQSQTLTLPIDPGYPIDLSLSVSPKEVSPGEPFSFQISLKNNSNSSHPRLFVQNNFPDHLKLINDLNGVEGVSLEKNSEGVKLMIASLDPQASFTIPLLFRVSGGIETADISLSAEAYHIRGGSSLPLSSLKTETIRVVPDDFMEQQTLIGKVFLDSNNNGYQDFGEKGIPGAQIITQEGIMITTDKDGLFSVPDLTEGSHVFNLLKSSLPEDLEVKSPSKTVYLRKGSLHKVNFPVSSGSKGAFVVQPQYSFSVSENLILPAPYVDISIDESQTNYPYINRGEENGILFQIDSNLSSYIENFKAVIKNKKTRQTVFSKSFETQYFPGTFTWNPIESELSNHSETYIYYLEITYKNGSIQKTPSKVFSLNRDKMQQTFISNTPEKLSSISFPVPKQGSIGVSGEWESDTSFYIICNQGGETVFKQRITTGSNGRFEYDCLVPFGTYKLVFSTTEDSENGFFEKEIHLKTDQFLFVGLAEETIGKSKITGNIKIAGEEDRFEEKFYHDGKASFFLKGKIKGKYLIKTAYDSEKDDTASFFRYLDPDKYYPVYGDHSQLDYQGVDGQGVFYFLIEWDRSSVHWGNYQTHLKTLLLDYNRTLHGGKAELKSLAVTPFGEPEYEVILFGSPAKTQKTVNRIEATGGSVYYLNQSRILEGSEQIFLEIRDSVSGLVIDEKPQLRDVHYEIDYEAGRIHFKTPVSKTRMTGRVTDTGLSYGNPIFITVHYEYEPDSVLENTSLGVRMKKSIGDHVSIGGSYVSDKEAGRPDAEIKEVDLTVHISPESRLNLEAASTSHYSPNTLVSQSGGIRYEKPQMPAESEGDAWAMEWITENQLGSFEIFHENRKPGFFNSEDLRDSGLKKTGTQISLFPDKNYHLFGEWYEEKVDDSFQSQTGYSKKTEGRFGISYEFGDKFNIETEYHTVREDEPDTSVDLFGIAAYLDLTAKLQTRFKHQWSNGDRDLDMTQAGLDYQLLDRLQVGLTGVTGDLGDYARVHAVWNPDETHEFYLGAENEHLGSSFMSDAEITMGYNYLIDPQSSLFTEYRYRNALHEKYTTTVSGYRKKINSRTQCYFTYENENTEAQESMVIGGGLSYSLPEKAWISTSLEVREDENSLDLDQISTRNKIKYYFDNGLSLFAKANYSKTKLFSDEDASFKEYGFGTAFRPKLWDRINFLFKYTYLEDNNPSSRDIQESLTREEASVYSGEFLLDLLKNVQYFFKYAWKDSIFAESLGDTEISSEVSLLINRFQIFLTEKAGTAVEYRHKEFEETDEVKKGAALEFFYDPIDPLRVTVGYNWTDFSDNLIDSNDYSFYGPYIRLTGRAFFEDLKFLPPFKREYYNWRLLSQSRDIQVNGRIDLCVGWVEDEFEWNLSKADKNEFNWRYLFGEDAENTVNEAIYNRLETTFKVPLTDSLTLQAGIVIDPHMQAFHSDPITVTGASGDKATFRFLYWGATDETISLTVRSENGNAFLTGERPVDGDIIHSYSIDTKWGDTFLIPETKLEKDYVPWQDLIIGYTGDDQYLKINFLTDEKGAVSTDDPLMLSGRKSFWQAHPWLYFWEPGSFYYGGMHAFDKGRLDDSLTHFYRNSAAKFLTYLRGMQFSSEIESLGRFEGGIASPITRWDLYEDYSNPNNLSGAFRYKSSPSLSENIQLGSTYVLRAGYNDRDLDFFNHAFAADGYFVFSEDLSVTMEYAKSYTKTDQTTRFAEDFHGHAFKFVLEKDLNLLDSKHSIKTEYTKMTDGFLSSVSDYRFTSLDQYWSRHLDFSEHSQWFIDSVLPFKLGDGIRPDRNVFSCSLFSQKEAFYQNYLLYMYIQDDKNNDFLESRIRDELTLSFTETLEFKALLLHYRFPDTKQGIEPLAGKTNIGDDLTPNMPNQPVYNEIITDSEDPSISTFSIGLKWAAATWMDLVGIYERTNNWGDQFPQFIIGDTDFGGIELQNAIRYDAPRKFIYEQGIFELPSYSFYDIYRLKMILKPWDPVRIQLSYTKNENKFAAGIDDNINHYFAEIKYEHPSKKYYGRMNFTRSKTMDVPRYLQTHQLNYESHDNFFAEFTYNLNQNSKLYAHYGFFAGMSDDPVSPYLVVPFALPVLDSKDVIRIAYSRKF